VQPHDHKLRRPGSRRNRRRWPLPQHPESGRGREREEGGQLRVRASDQASRR
jgi:hypothetical protein